MFTAGRAGKAGHSQIVVSIKVLVVWFFLARAILVVGVANGIAESSLWTVDIMLFTLTALYVLVRESVTDGLSAKLLAFAMVLTAGGIGIFASLPRNLGLKDMVQQPIPGIGSLPTLMDGDDTAAIDMRPVEHLARATRLIFDNPTIESIALARRHLLKIPPTAREYPSGVALQKAADVRMEQLQFKDSRATRSSGASSQAIEVIGSERTPEGWMITLRNTSNNRIGNITYELDCFDSGGWRTASRTQATALEKVMTPHETMAINFGLDVVPQSTVYASFKVVSSDVVKRN